jgi:type I restriction enzyme S subunit
MTIPHYRKAKELVTFRTGKLDSNAAVEGGRYPFFTCAQDTYRIDTHAFDTECVLLAGNNAGGIFPLKYYRGKFNAYQRTYIVESRDPQQLNIKYFYFYLRPLLKAFEQQATGATTKFLTLKILNNILVVSPGVTSQKKIAAILSAYDELVENNQRRIALLERLAEDIYREWFVRLRFPGHERVKVVKRIPAGWSFDKASTFFGLVKGKSYAGDEITDDPDHMPFISLKSFNRGGGYREDGLKYYSGHYKDEQVVRQNDVVIAITDMTQDRAVVGRVARIPNLGKRGAVISLDVVKLVPRSINNTFLYAYMRHSGFADFIKEFANGANVLHLIPELITKQKIAIPPRDLQEDFAPKACPLYAQVDLLGEANKRLVIMRDRLLPRLLSGKLSVENLDIQFPPGMTEELNAEPTATAHA